MKQHISSTEGTAGASKDNDRNRIFNTDGYLRDAELKVMNFKPFGCKSSIVKGKCWEEVIITHFLYEVFQKYLHNCFWEWLSIDLI